MYNLQVLSILILKCFDKMVCNFVVYFRKIRVGGLRVGFFLRMLMCC